MSNWICFTSRTDSSNQAMIWWILLESRNKAMDAWQFAKGLALWSEIWSDEVEIQKRKPIMGKEGNRCRCKIRSVACSSSQAEHVMDLTYVKTGKPSYRHFVQWTVIACSVTLWWCNQEMQLWYGRCAKIAVWGHAEWANNPWFDHKLFCLSRRYSRYQVS